MEKNSVFFLYKDFLSELEGKKKVEDKVRLCLDFMRGVLSQEKVLTFRDFWEAKKLCLDLFKGKISPHARSVFWSEYTELSDEVRKIKEVLDEQSSFAHEQMDLAITALESDLERGNTLHAELDGIEIPETMAENGESYQTMQKELNLLNTFAGRVNALRKELIPMSLRIRQKNRFFERLSQAGDQVFPRRKELIRGISEMFAEDIAQFVREEPSPPYFQRKEEIKFLQNFAKTLTLSTATFSETRESLSRYWDQVRQQEKEHSRKKVEKMAPSPLKEGEKVAVLERKKQEEERQKFFSRLLEVLDQAEGLPLEILVEKWETLVKEKKALSSEGIESERIESRLDTIADHIQEKRWQNLVNEDRGEIGSSLHSLLDERHKTRRKLKEKLELHRKAVGGSSLSVEESMLYQELIAEERLRLDAMETMIEEIEEKLFDLEE